MKVYNKLVRDKIPQIIEEAGKKPHTHVLDDEAYLMSLNHKLQEELDEYLEDESVEELADMVEVINAILNHKQVSLETFDSIRKKKTEDRGAFDKKIFLRSVEE
ncbi:MAG: nucleoside triphosphate pyrophosphohydrolase [Clostridiales bacterium]|nr:nucleoside triphosphate pyrophosphohydrolase [Clostridiales bacterium]